MHRYLGGLLLALLAWIPPLAIAEDAPAGMIDLSNAVIWQGPHKLKDKEFSYLLQQGIEERTGLRLKLISDWNEANGRPTISVATTNEHYEEVFGNRQSDGKKIPDAYRIKTDPKATLAVVEVVGDDDRGQLFGIGRLLRELRLSPGKVFLPADLQIDAEPKTKLRGHQLGYRAKTNSYDAWNRNQWYRYIQELALFGTNAIELLPPVTDDDLDSPHFPLPPIKMLREMSSICDEFSLDVWIWYPAMKADYGNPATVEKALKEWREVFKAMPRLDAVFVPGGDPGHTEPKILLAFLEKVTAVLHEVHPKADLWVSPQGFNGPWMDQFLTLLKDEPKWLKGVVHGPQVRLPLAEFRKAVPARYPIRAYPDITHSRQCQHPVPDWDLAYAVTEGREAINPRPLAQAALARAYQRDSIGFITYSEGCNDDVNKFVWSAIGWDPDADVVEVLRQYSRLFIGEKYADTFAQGLLALERNWSGPLLTNSGVETTLKQFQDMERDASPAIRLNWRFQQALYRAYYDAYLRDRLIQELSLEALATDVLRQAPRLGSELSMRKASSILERSLTEPVSLDRRARVFELGEALFQSIKMQLSKPKYQAIDPERGANLDTIDAPLNNRIWLENEFEAVRKLSTESERLKAIHALLYRDDPGPGGFYDDLGDPANSPHLVQEPSVAEDPLFAKASFNGFSLRTDWPVAWRQYAQAYYDAPVLMRYDRLDTTATYKLRVTYSGDSPKGRMRLEADGTVIHDLFTKPDPVRPVEFPLPKSLTADGRLNLKWNQELGRGGNGRGCQVAEVWLIRVE